MPKVICTLPNASELIDGIRFVSHKDGMVSEEISDAQVQRLVSIKGFSVIVKESKAEKAAREAAEREAEKAAEDQAARDAADNKAAEKLAADKAAVDKKAAEEASAPSAAGAK